LLKQQAGFSLPHRGEEKHLSGTAELLAGEPNLSSGEKQVLPPPKGEG